MKFLLAIIILLFALTNLKSEIIIKKSNIVPNTADQICVWTSIQTICNHLRIDSRGLLESRLHGTHYRYDGYWREVPNSIGYEDEVPGELKKRGIKFNSIKNYDTILLEDEVKDYPAVISVYNGAPTCQGRHAIVLTELTKKNYSYIDTNDPDCVYEGTRAYFDGQWTGFAVIIRGKDDSIYPSYFINLNRRSSFFTGK